MKRYVTGFSCFQCLTLTMSAAILLQMSCGDKTAVAQQPLSEVSGDTVLELASSSPLDCARLVGSQDFENVPGSSPRHSKWFLTSMIDVASEPGNAEKAKFYDEETKTFAFLVDWTDLAKQGIDQVLQGQVCPPKIELGTSATYFRGGSSSNMVLELDSDLEHCNIRKREPATILIKTYVPSRIGFRYQVTFDYRMRSYRGMNPRSYKNLVVNFGKTTSAFPAVFDQWATQSVETTDLDRNGTMALVFTDDGRPDSFGILIDNIKVVELGRVENYNSCLDRYLEKSEDFWKCVNGNPDAPICAK